MDYGSGFKQGQLVDECHAPPPVNASDEYIEGWVDGRMEAIRDGYPFAANAYEAMFLGSEGFGKATYRDMLNILTSGHPKQQTAKE